MCRLAAISAVAGLALSSEPAMAEDLHVRAADAFVDACLLTGPDFIGAEAKLKSLGAEIVSLREGPYDAPLIGAAEPLRCVVGVQGHQDAVAAEALITALTRLGVGGVDRSAQGEGPLELEARFSFSGANYAVLVSRAATFGDARVPLTLMVLAAL